MLLRPLLALLLAGPRAAGAAATTARALEAKLLGQLRRSSLEHGLIERGDHVAVCVSGGKDSAAMLDLLLRLQRSLRHTCPFELSAVHVDQGQPGYDGAPLVAWLASLGVRHTVVSEDTYSVVLDKTAVGKAYCSMCSRLRRGILYSAAEGLGANKIALGHHADDAIETLLLNLLHQAKLAAMPARYHSEARGLGVIRPLIGCFEADIGAYAQAMGFPILPCTLCGTQPDAQRAKVKLLVSALEGLNPHARASMLGALGDVRPSHLLDAELRAASGLDARTGRVVHERARAMRGYRDSPLAVGADADGGAPPASHGGHVVRHADTAAADSAPPTTRTGSSGSSGSSIAV